MVRPRAENYLERKQGILDAAAAMFAKHGFNGTSIAALADSCGVSKALLYHYYDSKEALLYDMLLVHCKLLSETASNATKQSDKPEEQLPDYFITAEDITPKAHVDIQAASQKWIDSSISKTANVPTDYPFEDFKNIYLYAYEQGLKGCTTFRFNPAAFQGVLVKEKDLENTTYRFSLDDGTVIEAKGNEEIEYDGEMHTAANLFDALKEGYYGKF